MIPYAKSYTATVTAKIPKLVQCEECQLEYVYIVERTAQGEGTSMLFLDNSGAQSRAEDKARQELVAALARGIEVVPCPGCGRVQEHMHRKARRQYRKWMEGTAIGLVLGAVVCGFVGVIGSSMYDKGTAESPLVGNVGFVLAGLCFVAGIGLGITKWVTSRGYDPNSEDVEARKQRGREKAMTRAEFEKLLSERPE